MLPAEGKSRRGGSNAHVPEVDRQAIQDTVASADLGNQGMSTKQCIEMVRAVCPSSIRIPASVTSIGRRAFSMLSVLESVHFETGIRLNVISEEMLCSRTILV